MCARVGWELPGQSSDCARACPGPWGRRRGSAGPDSVKGAMCSWTVPTRPPDARPSPRFAEGGASHSFPAFLTTHRARLSGSGRVAPSFFLRRGFGAQRSLCPSLPSLFSGGETSLGHRPQQATHWQGTGGAGVSCLPGACDSCPQDALLLPVSGWGASLRTATPPRLSQRPGRVSATGPLLVSGVGAVGVLQTPILPHHRTVSPCLSAISPLSLAWPLGHLAALSVSPLVFLCLWLLSPAFPWLEPGAPPPQDGLESYPQAPHSLGAGSHDTKVLYRVSIQGGFQTHKLRLQGSCDLTGKRKPVGLGPATCLSAPSPGSQSPGALLPPIPGCLGVAWG